MERDAETINVVDASEEKELSNQPKGRRGERRSGKFRPTLIHASKKKNAAGDGVARGGNELKRRWGFGSRP